jgi:predicted  nucleic acid-binding Zn-ribbon protein
MTVLEMAKAHLQNVHIRVEELQNQKRLIEEEINKLSLYIVKGLEDIEELEVNKEINDSTEEVSNK